MGSVADNTTLGQVLGKYFDFTLSITILPNHHVHSFIHSFIVVRMGNQLITDCSYAGNRRIKVEFYLLHVLCVCVYIYKYMHTYAYTHTQSPICRHIVLMWK